MKATVKKAQGTVNATIELRGVTLEEYQNILSYILSVDPDAFQDDASECVIASEAPVRENPAGNVKPKYIGPDKRLDILNRLFEDYVARTEYYKLEDLTFEEIVEHIPELFDIRANAFGNRYRTIQRNGGYTFLKVRTAPLRRTNIYRIPIRKNTYGRLIQKGRKDARLTQKELADLIRVPVELVRGLESGKFIPSKNSLSLLKDALGNDIFDELEC